MGQILLPRQYNLRKAGFNARPDGPTVIDRGNKFGSRVTYAFVAPEVNAREDSGNSDYERRIGQSGPYYYFGTTAGFRVQWPTTDQDTLQEFTSITQFIVPTGTNNAVNIYNISDRLSLVQNKGGIIGIGAFFFDGAGFRTITLGAFSDNPNTVSTVILTKKSGSGLSGVLYKDNAFIGADITTETGDIGYVTDRSNSLGTLGSWTSANNDVPTGVFLHALIPHHSTDAQLRELGRDPWQILKSAAAQIYTFPSDVGADVNVNATTDALTLAEQNATITLDVNVQTTTAALALSEKAAVVALNVEVAVATDALTLAEQAATVTIDAEVSATTDALTLAEQTAIVSLNVAIAAGVDALTLTENAATVSLDVNVAATTDALTLTEQAATVEAGLNVQATTDALTLIEFPATIEAAVNVQATTDALTLTENAATVDAEINVQANTDALTLVEFAASVTLDVNVAATTAALTLVERAAAIEAAINVQAITDNLVLTEFSATVALDVEIVATTVALTLVENSATVDVGDVNVLATTAELTLVEFPATITAVDIAGDGDISFSTQFDDSVNLVGAFDDAINLVGNF